MKLIKTYSRSSNRRTAPTPKPFPLKDYDDIVTAIDNLHGAIIDVFGADSRSASLAKELYQCACSEAKVLEKELDEKSDWEEFEAAHARIAASNTLAKSQGKGLK